jgi:subtilase family serine protease
MRRVSSVLIVSLILIFSILPFQFVLASQSTDFNYQPMSIFVQLSDTATAPTAIPFCQGGGLVCYTPNFVRTAYNFPTGLTGTGQTILIVDAYGSPTIVSDLVTFDSLFGLPAPPSFQIVCPDGCPTSNLNPRTHNPHDEFGWAIETSLDVEWAHAMAPGANIVLVVAPSSSGDAINSVEAKVIPLYPGSIMSQSFGIPEFLVHNNNAQVMQAHLNYIAAAKAGITVLASAGDSGASNGFSSANALYPSSDPFVTAVGGTMGYPYLSPFPPSCTSSSCSAGLATFDNSTGLCPEARPTLVFTCPAVGYGGEQVWNEPRFFAATGGAPSLLFGTPSYQSGLGLTSRTTPDVSYNAAVNGGVLVVALGGLFVVGGTSAGSPQWAAIFALVNQERVAHHEVSIGFANPSLYSLGHSSKYSNDFHDIVIGNNELFGTTVGFSATVGWDDASGWGTPNVSNLVNDLT